MNKKIILLGILIFVLIGSVGVTLYLTRQSQDNRSGAQVADESVQDECPVPAPPSDMFIDYPNCDSSGLCNFDQANCSWGDTLDAANYNVTVVQVESGQQVLAQTLPASTTQVQFDVVQRTTYKCTVTAVNSCGGTSISASTEQYCEVDALIESTPIPTTPPGVTTAVTPTPVPTVYVAPTQVVINETLPPTGGMLETVGIIAGVVAAIAVGAAFIIF